MIGSPCMIRPGELPFSTRLGVTRVTTITSTTMKNTVTLAFTLMTGFALQGRVTAAETDERPATRSFEFIYTTTISDIAAGQGPVHIFLPLPIESTQQSLDAWSITSSTGEGRDALVGSVETESEYGNRYWHAVLPEAYGAPIEIEARYEVTRRNGQSDPANAARELSDRDPANLAKYLAANARVVVDDPVLEPILAEIDSQSIATRPDDNVTVARSIYDWVVDNITYKKVGTGWGNGDTFWACSERYGNCTDFHSLFISLARTKDIPARFDMGFPVPEDRPRGNISGYHCWVNFYSAETGWFPVDASEAFNHPERRDLYFGGRPLDRIHFTTGRDLRLGRWHQDRPLNYFIYPYVEVDGKRLEESIDSHFSYRDLTSPAG